MLTEKQLAARAGKLTASRVKHLMRGELQERKKAIDNLWKELTNHPDFVPEDLSDNLPVAIGEATEPVNLRWYSKGGIRITRCGEVVVHPTYDYFAATLDGWDEQNRCPIECKHVGGREPDEIIIEQYQPQLQFQMFITDAKECALSMFKSNNEHKVIYVERDDSYIAIMVQRGQQFMQHVWDRTPPVVLDPVPSPIVADKSIDMNNNEVWARHASQWLQVHGAADVARECEKVLKSLVPEDCKKAYGWGVRITRARPFRDRPGALSLREDKE